ncbi:glycoside hydrolase family 47 protein [Thozetella sp. PMI_491]|nr:glycoside hydrolase family 47 protein [Thozetella sp. PMI_491]
MLFGRRRFSGTAVVLILFVIFLWGGTGDRASESGNTWGASWAGSSAANKVADDPNLIWRRLPLHFPVNPFKEIPNEELSPYPPTQHDFEKEDTDRRDVRLLRQEAVKKAFLRCWRSYRDRAWGRDELMPVSGQANDTFGGWGATLVDSLDTLWIMGLRDEFQEAVGAAILIDFTNTTASLVNVFETTIRYLGGFIAAYDLSGDLRLLKKAKEVADMLYVAFDTENHMPVTRWNLTAAKLGQVQVPKEQAVVAEIGSLCMEFTRLTLITGNPKYFDATQRIMEALEDQQMQTYLPGMWPAVVNTKDLDFRSHSVYTLGALADSTYEYLPKMQALTGGRLPAYERMYKLAMETAIRHNIYRPMIPDNKDILISGQVDASTKDGKNTTTLVPLSQHLTCFAGGMFALGSRLFGLDDHMALGEKLTDGCIWVYKAMPLGIMPEWFVMIPCDDPKKCEWDEDQWKRSVLQSAGEDVEDLDSAERIAAQKRIPPGFTSIPDPKYVLRPEALESVFLLYRMTGKVDLMDAGWAMFDAINTQTKTSLANSALVDVTVARIPEKSDSMESFFLGETLKYAYLLFSEPDVISLDEYVFNTEAHPFKRARR